MFEVVDNSVDEALAGHCNEISVTMLADGSIEVQDNGRGIPCTPHPSTGKSSLETVLCVLHAGGKFGGEDSGYKVSGGLHGVGLSVVNALSEELCVEVVRDGTFHTMSFSKGVPTNEITTRPAVPGVERRGTKVTFKPDPSIFKATLAFEFDQLASRLDELAYLNAGLTIHLIDKRSKAFIDAQRSSSSALLSTSLDDEEQQPKETEAATVTADQIHAATTISSAGAPSLLLSQSSAADAVGIPGAAYKNVTYRHDGGIRELVEMMCRGKSPLLSEGPSSVSTTGKEGELRRFRLAKHCWFICSIMLCKPF